MIDLAQIRQILVTRRKENLAIGIDGGGVFDTKVLALYGEQFIAARFPGARIAETINNASWDVKLPDGKTIQVKTRAVYHHNNDAIHIDFSDVRFDFLFLLVVNESMDHLAELLIPARDLLTLLRPHARGQRLQSVRTSYASWKLKWSLEKVATVA